MIKERVPALEYLAEEPLCAHTSFKIGGAAELMLFPKTIAELRAALEVTHALEIKPLILGAGTNVLAPDEGVRGVVIVTRGCLEGIEKVSPTRLVAMAGTTMAKLAMTAQAEGLSGLEFAHGIPGTVGGGIYMNAGAYGGEMKQVAYQTEFMFFDGTMNIMRLEEQELGYRTSTFQKRDCVILRTWFDLVPGDKEEIKKTMQTLAEKRRASQPLELPSAGSFFKRPEGAFAGTLIDQAGLKGYRVGGAAVSEKHAGFVVNLGGATRSDIEQLMHDVQRIVLEKSGFSLEPEVKFL
ncbi:MAG: UDP-N-acetylmuramate dehydrogenase [Clostridia bacterium]|nr:UDP-N-acetylmuramate dehydrogenase [Clostridia bacterium]